MINARSETAHEKPSYRAAFKRRRYRYKTDEKRWYKYREPHKKGSEIEWFRFKDKDIMIKRCNDIIKACNKQFIP